MLVGRLGRRKAVAARPIPQEYNASIVEELGRILASVQPVEWAEARSGSR